jgi:hypothetical protein
VSIQAVAWALEQDLPARPKLVLVSIANHADHTTGYCWLRADTIAAEAACTSRAVYNFVGDLIRNGYIRKAQRKGDDGKQRANDYWILFNRQPADWIKDRVPGEADGAGEPSEENDPGPQDVVAPGEHHSCGEDDVSRPAEPVEMHAGSPGPHESTFTRKDSEEPSKTKPKEARASFAGPPRAYRPPPPEPQGAVADREAKQIFVFKGSRAWEAWCDHKLRTTGVRWTLTTWATIDGRRREGWYFPGLFPPSATGPPNNGTEEIIDQF